MGRLAALAAVLVAGFLLFYSGARTPAPLAANAPAAAFSAGRAISDIAEIAKAPHPVGSSQNAAARDYLIARMTTLGLSPQVQRDRSQRVETYGGQNYMTGGDVENLIGVLPGRNPSLPALALMAHYDSVPGSPGAADDATGVASALEAVRAIKAQGAPARDVMVVLTDGEEAGLLGANAFFADSPLASHVGFVLNMEARGGGGRTAMFETGDGNGAAIALYRRAAPRPDANSLSVFLYKNLPNDTDYTVAKAHGVPGLNFAFIGRQFDYHSPSSTADVLDLGSVQHMGEQILGVARALAFAASLPPRAPDAVYGTVPGGWMLAYPIRFGWGLITAIAILLALAAWRAGRREPLAWLDVLQGAGATLLVMTVSALLLHLTRRATGVGFGWIEGRALLARFAPFEAAMALSGLGGVMLAAAALSLGRIRIGAAALAITAGLASSLFGGFDPVGLGAGAFAAVLALSLCGRQVRFGGGWLGLLLVALAVALGLQVAAPTIGFLVAWPLAAAAACAALSGLAPPRGWACWIGLLLIAVLVVAWIGDVFHSLLQAMDAPELPLVPLWLGSLALWPLVWPRDGSLLSRLAPGAALVVLGLGLALGLDLTSPWSPRHPTAAELYYVLDQDDLKAYRVSPLLPDPWAQGVLTADGGRIERIALPTFRHPVWAASARPIPVVAPPISMNRSPDGRIILTAALENGAQLALELKVDGGAQDVQVNGKPAPILSTPGRPAHLRWNAAPEGLTISFRPLGHGQAEAVYAYFKPGWPGRARALPPMPPDVMAWNLSGFTVATGNLHAR